MSKRSGAKNGKAGAGAIPEKLRHLLDGLSYFLKVERGGPAAAYPFQAPLTVTQRCNQRCPFCQANLDDSAGDPPLERVLAAVKRLARLLPGAKLMVTGGEPTLRRDLGQLLRELVNLPGLGLVELQTNGVLLRRHADLVDLPADRLRFLVALHEADAESYDRCTRSRGMLQDALAAVDWLLEHGREVELNCVVSALNLTRLESYIDGLAGRFGARCPPVHFSVMGMPEQRDVTGLLVPFSETLERLRLARARAAAAGIATRVAYSASHSAVPPCLSDGDAEAAVRYCGEHEGAADGDQPKKWWLKPASCKPCKWFDRCPGINKSYARRFGTGELRPVLK